MKLINLSCLLRLIYFTDHLSWSMVSNLQDVPKDRRVKQQHIYFIFYLFSALLVNVDALHRYFSVAVSGSFRLCSPFSSPQIYSAYFHWFLTFQTPKYPQFCPKCFCWCCWCSFLCITLKMVTSYTFLKPWLHLYVHDIRMMNDDVY